MFLGRKSFLGHTAPLNEKVTSNGYYATLQSDRFKNPYKQVLPSKFPKNNHRVRKPTYNTIVTQTTQSKQKPCIRMFQYANRSIVFENPQSPRRQKAYGEFHCRSLQSFPIPALNRSFEDLGVRNNKKHIVKQARNNQDPILVGQKQKVVKNSHHLKVWAQQRKHLNNGIKTRETLNWPIKKDKQKLYCFVNKEKIDKTFKI